MKTTTIDWQEYGIIMEKCAAYVAHERPLCNTPAALASVVAPLVNLHDGQEGVYVACLDVKLRLMEAPRLVTLGALDKAYFGIREIFRYAIATSAASIILIHNHPSGDSVPSQEDKEVTQKAQEAGKLLGIRVLDHLIIGRGEFVSMHELGVLGK